MCSSFLLLLLFICVSRSDQKPTIKEIKALSDRLMTNYSKHILPTESDDPYNVTIYVFLEALGNIDEIDEKLSTVLWFDYFWRDESIKWDREETNISYITLGWNDVWKPVLQLTNPQTDSTDKPYYDRSYDSVIYSYEGLAYYDELMTTRTSCDLDMSYYPFDVQTCEIKLRIFGSTKFAFNLSVEINKDFSIQAAEHGSWKLNKFNVTKRPYFIGSFVIELNFERRPLFILLNIILPLLILALLTPIVFLLPKKSGERVGYAVAMLLAISMYMTIVSEHLPTNSKPAPLMPIMIFVWYVFDAFVILVVIIITNINLTPTNKQMPGVLRHFVLLTRKISCQKTRKVTEKASSEEVQRCIEMEKVNNQEKSESSDETESCEHDVTWKDLSHALDKWFFVISYVLKLALPVVFLTVMALKGQK